MESSGRRRAEADTATASVQEKGTVAATTKGRDLKGMTSGQEAPAAARNSRAVPCRTPCSYRRYCRSTRKKRGRPDARAGLKSIRLSAKTEPYKSSGSLTG